MISICAGFGQSTDASIAGRVVDDKGETLPGVDGRYRLRQLPLGRPYTVRASFVGSGTPVKNSKPTSPRC